MVEDKNRRRRRHRARVRFVQRCTGARARRAPLRIVYNNNTLYVLVRAHARRRKAIKTRSKDRGRSSLFSRDLFFSVFLFLLFCRLQRRAGRFHRVYILCRRPLCSPALLPRRPCTYTARATVFHPTPPPVDSPRAVRINILYAYFILHKKHIYIYTYMITILTSMCIYIRVRTE